MNRTVEALLHKNEQILDALERGAISPKTAEQLNTCNEMPLRIANFEKSYLKMIQDFGKRVPVPRSSLIRSMIPGLDPNTIAPTDGENVRALLIDKNK